MSLLYPIMTLSPISNLPVECFLIILELAQPQRFGKVLQASNCIEWKLMDIPKNTKKLNKIKFICLNIIFVHFTSWCVSKRISMLWNCALITFSQRRLHYLFTVTNSHVSTMSCKITITTSYDWQKLHPGEATGNDVCLYLHIKQGK